MCSSMSASASDRLAKDSRSALVTFGGIGRPALAASPTKASISCIPPMLMAAGVVHPRRIRAS